MQDSGRQTASDQFTATTLPSAVSWVFETNGYSVKGPVHVHGAEVDLVATSMSGLRPMNIYIEVTVEYVDTAKYGKDLTKLVMFTSEVGAQRIIVSSKGFTPDVRERALAAGIDTYTYEELFRTFEKTDPYVDAILTDSPLGVTLHHLNEVYEEPEFEDDLGKEKATNYLADWLRDPSPSHPWLVIVGEYGTGKTALTQILQLRWAQLYRQGIGTPLPFRIELRDFTRQFDARGLLHHFMDRNYLAHMPVDFVESMIAQGRVVLLLDGYDEMAQYLNVRERRACLSALADLASGGARGILTSRPNYFTEAEELRVYEVLYQQLSRQRTLLDADRAVLSTEQKLDAILDRFLVHRRERNLKDLNPEQTEALIRRQLSGDPVGADLVIGLLRRVFRSTHESGEQSLGGKPVIISYLLDVVAELKTDKDELSAAEGLKTTLSEWEIFGIIVNKLMLRDYHRVTELLPSERKTFLTSLAMTLAKEHKKALTENDFADLVREHFRTLIQRRTTEGVTDFATALIDDLRSSSTLTRSPQVRGYTWGFSHNSLREFLLTSAIIGADDPDRLVPDQVPLTDSMLLFARSMPRELSDSVKARITRGWPARLGHKGLDQLLSLTWMSFRDACDDSVRKALTAIVGEGLDLSGCRLTGMNLAGHPGHSVDLRGLNASGSELAELDLSYTDLGTAKLDNAVLDACELVGCSLRQASAHGIFMLDCNLTGIDVDDASFLALDRDSTAFIEQQDSVQYLQGEELVGYLAYLGAKTDPIDPIDVFRHSPNFDIFDNILRNLGSGRWSQRRGLEQRGPSQKDVTFARSFVESLLGAGIIEAKGGAPNLVGPTQPGRQLIAKYVNGSVDPSLAAAFREASRK